jgi:hypothetical protein
MGILRDQNNRLKKDTWCKNFRRWLKFKLWLWKHGHLNNKNNELYFSNERLSY